MFYRDFPTPTYVKKIAGHCVSKSILYVTRMLKRGENTLNCHKLIIGYHGHTLGRVGIVFPYGLYK